MGEDDDNHYTSVDAVEPGQPDRPLAPGTNVNGYIVEGVLGQGGMGVVYGVTHGVIGKKAAIKVLRSEVSLSPITVERFVQEARAVNQIGHPNIVNMYDVGQDGDMRWAIHERWGE